MTTDPPRSEPGIVALVRSDIDRAVRDAVQHTASPYSAAGRLEDNLTPLRERLAMLAQRRPELLVILAAHFDVAATHADVAAAVDRCAQALLERIHETADPAPGATADNNTTAGAQRLRDSTHAHHRTPPDKPQSPAARPR